MFGKAKRTAKGSDKGAVKRLRKVPLPEKKAKTVSAERFNDMILYYSAELNSRLAEIAELKKRLDVLTATSIKQTERLAEAESKLKNGRSSP